MFLFVETKFKLPKQNRTKMKKNWHYLAPAFIYNEYLFHHEEHEAHKGYIPKINLYALHVLHGFNLEVA